MQVDDITVQNRVSFPISDFFSRFFRLDFYVLLSYQFHSFKLGRSSTSSSDTSLSSKRGSHHRRNSSVSTRHESAEMMGFSLPELPASAADDAMEKDSIRKRALWALEGRCDPSTTTVELPTPESVNYDFRASSSLSTSFLTPECVSTRMFSHEAFVSPRLWVLFHAQTRLFQAPCRIW
jgi:hypothetical protein